MADLALRRSELDDLAYLGQMLKDSGMFEDVHTVAQAGVKVLAGRELGLGPVESMRSFHVIGKAVEPTADLLARLVRRHPRYDYAVVEATLTRCEIEFYDDGVACGRASHDEEDREREGLALKTEKGKPTQWARYPLQMHFARAMTKGVGMFMPDVVDAIRSEAPPDVEVLSPSPDSGEVEAPAPGHDTSGASTVGAVVEAGDGSDRSAAPGTEPDTDPESGTVLAGEDAPRGETPDDPASAAASGEVGVGHRSTREGAAGPTSSEPPDPVLVTKKVVDRIGSIGRVERYVAAQHPDWGVRTSADLSDEQWSALLEELKEGASA